VAHDLDPRDQVPQKAPQRFYAAALEGENCPACSVAAGLEYAAADLPPPVIPARALDANGALPAVVAALLGATDRETKERAWGAFVERYTRLLLNTAYRFGHSYDGAMDRYAYLLEQLHSNDFRRLRVFAASGPGRFSTWLVVVARRLLLDYHRQRYGRARPPTAEGLETTASLAMRRHLAEMAGEEIPLSDIQDCSVPDPETAMHAAERTEAVRAAVSSLPPHDQLLLRLRFEEGLPAHAIADALDLPSQFHVYRRLRAVLAVLGRLLPREHSEGVPLECPSRARPIASPRLRTTAQNTLPNPCNSRVHTQHPS
jgi:RNA polymerase sigma factor (sigma-70 family)